MDAVLHSEMIAIFENETTQERRASKFGWKFKLNAIILMPRTTSKPSNRYFRINLEMTLPSFAHSIYDNSIHKFTRIKNNQNQTKQNTKQTNEE